MTVKDANDLIQRMEIIDKKKEERRKCISNEYESTKNSPEYYRKTAYVKLQKIINDIQSYDDFILYMEREVQVMSIDEYMALENIFNDLRALREQFEDKRNDK